jgi:hypothetical protein
MANFRFRVEIPSLDALELSLSSLQPSEYWGHTLHLTVVAWWLHFADCTGLASPLLLSLVQGGCLISMKCRTPLTPYSLVWLALLTLLWAAIPAVAQTQTTSPQAQAQSQDNDATRHQLADFDRFLDSHPEIGEQLKRDPGLVNDQKFAADHPALRRFLAEHPQVREQYQENPRAFMRQENGFDRSEDTRGRDLTRHQLADFDRFLDGHPEIAEQLKRDPGLVNDQKFAADHPALQQFLAEHPQVREQSKENPQAFMRQENGFDRSEDSRGRDLTRPELANLDRFLDGHPEIAEQLKRDPGLVNDQKFAADHPALQQFLAEHPEARKQYKENPQAFMRQENGFDHHEDSTMHRDHDLDRGELSSFNRFLGDHGNISRELSRNPSLAKNPDYLRDHPALQDYLNAHPQLHRELSENPQAFLRWAQRYNPATTATPSTTDASKTLKATQNK